MRHLFAMAKFLDIIAAAATSLTWIVECNVCVWILRTIERAVLARTLDPTRSTKATVITFSTCTRQSELNSEKLTHLADWFQISYTNSGIRRQTG